MHWITNTFHTLSSTISRVHKCTFYDICQYFVLSPFSKFPVLGIQPMGISNVYLVIFLYLACIWDFLKIFSWYTLPLKYSNWYIIWYTCTWVYGLEQCILYEWKATCLYMYTCYSLHVLVFYSKLFSSSCMLKCMLVLSLLQSLSWNDQFEVIFISSFHRNFC